MIQNGARPTELDPRDQSFHGTFGALPTYNLPEEFNVDAGKTMPDQNADGYPFGCTGYTQSDNAIDRDGNIYKPSYTYLKTCFMEGHQPNQGCDMRASLKSTRVYGLQKETETTDMEAEQHRGGQYFNVYDDGGLDWFDAIRSSVYSQKHAVSCGSPWFSEWALPQVGILPSVFTYDGIPNHYAWHNYAIKGWKVINGTTYLLVKPWQGKNYGDNGWVYMSRYVANKVFEIRGAVIYTQASAKPEDIAMIKLDIWEYIMIFLNRIAGLKRLN